MSKKELDRLIVVKEIIEGKKSQKAGACYLKISVRQFSRLIKSYIENGEKGIVSKRRGKISNNKISSEIRERAMNLVIEKYYDFGPTLAVEKLNDVEGIKLSKETLRKWMIEENVWKSKSKKAGKTYQLRERRSKYGELIQIDGSPHDWFEGRRESCTLLVFIDDATGEFMELRFEEAETTEGYCATTIEYLNEFGIPRAFYSDRHSIFRINRDDPKSGNGFTQFGRAAKEIGIEIIYANTPQAKGRVERANHTLQDRLVKELRLMKIDTIQDANEFLKEYKHELNDKFAVKAKSPENGHRKVTQTTEELNIIFSIHSERTISKDLEIRYNNVTYQIQTERENLTMKGSKATICEHFDGTMTILYKGKNINYSIFKTAEKQMKPESAKTLNKRVDRIIRKQDGNQTSNELRG